jgi:hypothetical protein
MAEKTGLKNPLYTTEIAAGGACEGIPAGRQSQLSAWKWRISGSPVQKVLAARQKGLNRP